MLPVFLSYALSFIYVGIYWNNHHHMLHAVKKVDGRSLWANLHLLFWLSLTPFVTSWMGDTHFAALPVAAYGAVLLFAAIAYWLLSRALIAGERGSSALAEAIGSDTKAKASLVLYVVAILAAFLDPRVSGAIYVAVALLWFVPDRRIEKALARRAE
jgi:uncharacterized membrane protein